MLSCLLFSPVAGDDSLRRATCLGADNSAWARLTPAQQPGLVAEWMSGLPCLRGDFPATVGGPGAVADSRRGFAWRLHWFAFRIQWGMAAVCSHLHRTSSLKDAHILTWEGGRVAA